MGQQANICSKSNMLMGDEVKSRCNKTVLKLHVLRPKSSDLIMTRLKE